MEFFHGTFFVGPLWKTGKKSFSAYFNNIPLYY